MSIGCILRRRLSKRLGSKALGIPLFSSLASAFASERTSRLLLIYQREQPAVVLCWFLSFSLMSTSCSFTCVLNSPL